MQQHSYVEHSQQLIERPDCTKCGARMWLTRIEPYEQDHNQRTFECQTCGNSNVEII